MAEHTAERRTVKRLRITAGLVAEGWTRCGDPADEVGECTWHYGCTRAGRWTHPYVIGAYCAQHANYGGPRP